MQDNRLRDKLLATVATYYKFKIEEESEGAFILAVDDLASYPEENFTKLVNKLNSHGFVAFTGPEGSERVYVVRKETNFGKSQIIKLLLIAGSIGSLIYTGWSYQIPFSSHTSYLSSILTSVLLFLVPIILIIIARELGRFMANRINGMKYHLPILVPGLFGPGVLGSIAGQEQAYVSKRAMFHAGFFPLISGFLASLTVIIVGSTLHYAGNSLIAPVNSSLKSVSLPLIYSLFLVKISPESVTLNLVQYAGWIGITINALNAFPIGYLDGGLISKALAARYSKYISYGSLIALFLLSYEYLPWFVLIAFILLTGINGPEPLLSTSRLSTGTRVLASIAMLIFVLSIVPIPYHVIPNNISVQVSDGNAVLINGTNSPAVFDFVIYNQGSSRIAPSFSITPSWDYTVSGSGGIVNAGQKANYNLSVLASDFQRAGTYDFTVSVFSPSGSKAVLPLSVLVVNLTDQMSFNNQIPYKCTGHSSKEIRLNFSYFTGLQTQNFTMFSFADSGFSYNVTMNNLTFHEKGYSVPFSNPFSILPGQILPITLKGFQSTNDWTVVIMGNHYNAAVAYITLGG